MATFRSELRIDPPLKELRTALKELDAALPKALNKVTKQGAEIISADARGRAGGISPAAAAAAGQIKPSGTAQGAAVTLSRSAKVPWAMAAILGQDQRSGWYARDRYASSTGRQAPPWMGTKWTVGDPSGGPRAINPAIAAKSPELIRFLDGELTAFASKHFPEGN